jgi:hypothetical protein
VWSALGVEACAALDVVITGECALVLDAALANKICTRIDKSVCLGGEGFFPAGVRDVAMMETCQYSGKGGNHSRPRDHSIHNSFCVASLYL